MATLHLMVGLPCSGKTSLAKELEADLRALRLTADDWHRDLFGQDAAEPDHDARHAAIETLQWQVAAAALSHGVDVILDFGFWTRAERQDYRQRAAALGAATTLHVLDVPFEELLGRLDARNRLPADQVTRIPPSLMAAYRARFEPVDADELAPAPRTLRKQYHRRTVGADIHVWDVHKLIRAAAGLPQVEVALAEIAELDETWWYQDPGSEPTPRSLAGHMALVARTDLAHPVILCADGRLMDGMHRVVKALLENRRTVPAVRFAVTPPPDFVNVSLDDLPYPDEAIERSA